MNIGWLQDFIALADTGSFTRAAERRNASQPAFSRRIMALEAWLNVALVDRSVFPIRLTAQGEGFRDRAAEILEHVSEARNNLSGRSGLAPELVRIALPHTLATGYLGTWIPEWSAIGSRRHKIVTGNSLDIITMFAADGVDILICFHSDNQPLHLDDERYEHVVIGRERMRPYYLAAGPDVGQAAWPGAVGRPVPLLMYSPETYLASVVNQILEGARTPLHGAIVLESDMPDVLRTLALSGQGYAFLLDCTAKLAENRLAPVPDERWSYPLSIVAFKSRANRRASTQRLWSHLTSRNDKPMFQRRGALRAV